VPAIPRNLPPVAVAPGSWLFTCRAGSERDVQDELLLSKVSQQPMTLAPALVVAGGLPKSLDVTRDLAFVRQGFRIVELASGFDMEARMLRAVTAALKQTQHYALQVWVPDSPQGNAHAALAQSIEARLVLALGAAMPQAERVDEGRLQQRGEIPLIQICLVDVDRVAIGVERASRTISLAPGGRTRAHVRGELPSRSARKLEEALRWMGTGPGPGETCVDLGAAPGGWTFVLASRGAHVTAVDLAQLDAKLLQRRTVRVARQNAFHYQPEETVDWLFCDMAYRPLEVAALLAKWARSRWARLLVANLKLPMTRKAEILVRIKQVLQEGGWRELRAKQLYHDRDEVTIRGYTT
jgi:23S rRNA (cytidine2498-2'-O)-methyltransferase